MPAKLTKLRANKKGDINTSIFNFLENLLVFRTLEDLSVPVESGVKFRISRQENDPGICLLIHIDNLRFPIIDDGPRPDYLAIYLHGTGCICTIIEMKGHSEKNLKHGLSQISALADRLKGEFKNHLPSRFRLYIQGLLLCPFNSQVPSSLIQSMSASGLTIFPALCNDRAELYPYISQKIELKNKFENKLRHPAPPKLLEKMISQDTLKKRVTEGLPSARLSQGNGLHIDFVLSDQDEYATLITRNKKCVFIIHEQGDKYRQELQADIDANGLGEKFDVEAAPER